MFSPRWLRAGLWSLSAALILFRVPRLLSDPRFCFEEGEVYFQHAWHADWFDAITSPQFDYLALVPNVATTLARHVVPLEFAPLVTTTVGFLIQLAVLGIIIEGKAGIWERPLNRLLGVAVVLLAATRPYLWGTSLAAQYHLALGACLVLIEPSPGRGQVRRRVLLLSIVALAGTTGLLSCALLPLFVIRAVKNRDALSRWLALTLAAGAAAQAAQLMARIGALDAVMDHRTQDMTGNLAAIVCTTRVLVAGVAGDAAANGLGTWAIDVDFGLAASAVGWLGLTALFIMVRASGKRDRESRNLGLCLVIQLVLTLFASLGDKSNLLVYGSHSVRYFLVPLALFALLYIRRTSDRGVGRWVAIGIVSVTLVQGAWNYAHPADLHTTSWRADVAAWRRGDQNFARSWPPAWGVLLTQQPTRVAVQRLERQPATRGGTRMLGLRVEATSSGVRIRVNGRPGMRTNICLHEGVPVSRWTDRQDPETGLYVPRQSLARPWRTVEIPQSGVWTGELRLTADGHYTSHVLQAYTLDGARVATAAWCVVTRD